MAGRDMSFRPSAVTSFLVKQNVPESDLHALLQRAYGDASMGARWWVTHFKDDKADICCQPRSRKLDIQMSFETYDDKRADAEYLIATSTYTRHMDSTWYTPDFHVVTIDI